MSYQLEDGLPIPTVTRSGRPLSPERATMTTMDVGQSFLVPDFNRWQFVRGITSSMKPKRYSIHKVDGGWRVWRIE